MSMQARYDQQMSPRSEVPGGKGEENVQELPTVEISTLERRWYSKTDCDKRKSDSPIVEIFTMEPFNPEGRSGNTTTYGEPMSWDKPYGRFSPNRLANAIRVA